jgi:CRP-like cAMP-binding protein
VVVQLDGTASLMSSNRLREKANAFPGFRKVLMQYDHFLFSQVQQNVACNAAHGVKARTCKWLLRMHELAGSDLKLTHEFLAQMMGVRRTTVTEVAGEFQKGGMISYHRGHLKIVDLDQIRHWACECDDAIRSNYRTIFLSNEG